MPRTGDTPRARELGVALRDARDAAGLTTRRLAELLDVSNVRITRWETGQYPPSEADTATALSALGVTGAERDRLLALARDAADPNWLAPGVDKQLGALIDYERTALAITEVNPLLIPGLLQTADYAHSIMVGAGVSRGEIDQRVTLRMGRRDVLTRARNPVRLTALIGEHALRFPPCAPSIMADQLRHLATMARLDTVTIQAVPLAAAWSPLLSGPFIVLTFERTRPLVHLEHYRSSATLTDPGDVRDYQTAADIVRRVAMSPDATSGLIAGLIDEMEQRYDDGTPLAEVQP